MGVSTLVFLIKHRAIHFVLEWGATGYFRFWILPGGLDLQENPWEMAEIQLLTQWIESRKLLHIFHHCVTCFVTYSAGGGNGSYACFRCTHRSIELSTELIIVINRCMCFNAAISRVPYLQFQEEKEHQNSSNSTIPSPCVAIKRIHFERPLERIPRTVWWHRKWIGNYIFFTTWKKSIKMEWSDVLYYQCFKISRFLINPNRFHYIAAFITEDSIMRALNTIHCLSDPYPNVLIDSQEKAWSQIAIWCRQYQLRWLPLQHSWFLEKETRGCGHKCRPCHFVPSLSTEAIRSEECSTFGLVARWSVEVSFWKINRRYSRPHSTATTCCFIYNKWSAQAHRRGLPCFRVQFSGMLKWGTKLAWWNHPIAARIIWPGIVSGILNICFVLKQNIQTEIFIPPFHRWQGNSSHQCILRIGHPNAARKEILTGCLQMEGYIEHLPHHEMSNDPTESKLWEIEYN